MNYDFEKDLKKAKSCELEIALYLVGRGNKVTKSCDDKRYDIEITNRNGQKQKIEVKEDFMHSKTGNIAIEYECRGKPSGINTTESDQYIYKIHYSDRTSRIFSIKTDNLKRLLKERQNLRSVTGGDAESNTKFYLLNDRDISENFIRLA